MKQPIQGKRLLNVFQHLAIIVEILNHKEDLLLEMLIVEHNNNLEIFNNSNSNLPNKDQIQDLELGNHQGQMIQLMMMALWIC